MSLPGGVFDDADLVQMKPEIRLSFENFDRIVNLVADLKNQVDKANNEKPKDELIPRTQFLEEYGISSATEQRWWKSGYLTRIKIGSKVMYRRSDLDRIFNSKIK